MMHEEDNAQVRSASPSAEREVCPECGSFRSRALSIRLLYVFILMFAAGGGLIAAGYPELAFVVMILFGPALAWTARDLGKRRCDACGWKFRTS